VDDQLLAFDTWELLAQAYSDRVETKPHNALYERPATLSLLPPIKGKRVLDAGCGPGVYAQLLASQGAEVVGIDRSPRMVELARKRVGRSATIIEADVNQPLEFAADEWFDIVLSALTLDYIRDWRPVFREFHRVLRLGGRLVFSIGHPLSDYLRNEERASYFEVECLEETWTGFGFDITVPFYRRPLSEVINPLAGAGFELEEIHEPRPLEGFRNLEPDDYDELMQRPGFLCVRARKRPAAWQLPD
jgi:SAM-dependent methyltransferase